MRLTTRREGDLVIATLEIPAPGRGIVRVNARASVAVVRAIIDRAIKAAEPSVGFSFKKLFKAAAKIAGKVAKSKVLQMAGKIINNPLVKAIIPPQISMALGAANAAMKAIRAAKGGSAEAKAAIAKAAGQARGGNPIAAAALKAAAAATGTKIRIRSKGALALARRASRQPSAISRREYLAAQYRPCRCAA